MKIFIFNVYKNKKWITLGLSILYLLLFCFPLKYRIRADESIYRLPYIISLLKSLIGLPQSFNTLSLNSDPNIRLNAICGIVTNITCALLMLATFIMAIICLVFLFKGKNFYFVWSLSLALLTMLIQGIYFDMMHNKTHKLDLCPTFYIFLILLILDIVYLVLEKHYKVKELIKPIAIEDNAKNI